MCDECFEMKERPLRAVLSLHSCSASTKLDHAVGCYCVPCGCFREYPFIANTHCRSCRMLLSLFVVSSRVIQSLMPTALCPTPYIAACCPQCLLGLFFVARRACLSDWETVTRAKWWGIRHNAESYCAWGNNALLNSHYLHAWRRIHVHKHACSQTAK